MSQPSNLTSVDPPEPSDEPPPGDTSCWWTDRLVAAAPHLDDQDLDRLASLCADATYEHLGDPDQVAEILSQATHLLFNAGHAKLADALGQLNVRVTRFASESNRERERMEAYAALHPELLNPEPVLTLVRCGVAASQPT